MNSLDNRLLSIEQATELFIQNKKQSNVNNQGSNTSFQDIFFEKVNGNIGDLKFSKHANERLESRNINLSTEQMERLSQGVSKARGKSINESLVMMDNLAFIVNIKNNTVVTALEQNEGSNVFTNIDGAVIV